MPLGSLTRHIALLAAASLTHAAAPHAAAHSAARQEALSLDSLQETASMSAARAAHTASALPDYRVLVVGGFTGEGGNARGAEVYDPAAQRFLPLPRMITLRHSHTATVLPTGQVLIVGGYGAGATTLAVAELFDPASNSFTPTGSLLAPRAGHIAVLLATGMVLIAGGIGPGWTFLASAELYDPATGTFAPASPMSVARESHTASLLQDGRVLITGGHRDRRPNITLYASAETYDAATGVFSRVGDMQVRRHKHDAVVLRDGRVLITGGADERDSRGTYNSTELFHPGSGTFTRGPAMKLARYKHNGASTLLPNGAVLIAGGASRAEILDPLGRMFSIVGGDARMAGQFSAAAPTRAGQVLITGGYGDGRGPQASAWLYRPARAARTPRPAARMLLDGVHVVDVGSGTVLRDRQIVIAAGRIVTVRPTGTPAIAGDSLVGSFRGHYVIPGLIDTHVHLGSNPREPAVLRGLLEAAAMGGVTTVRDMGGRGDVVRPLLGRSGIMPRVLGAAIMTGPRSMWFTGPRAEFLSGGTDASAWVRRIERAGDAAPAISAAKSAGASGIKLYSDLTREVVDALSRTATDSGMLVWSHAAIAPATPLQAIEAGVQILSHADQIAWVGDDSRIPVSGPGGALRDSLLFNMATSDARLLRLFAAMRARGAALEPTLTVMSGGLLNADTVAAASSRRFVRAVGALTLAAHRAGVRVVAGTDALGGSTPNIHAELQLLVHMAGFTPAEALRAATIDAARALRRDDLGLIASGRIADLVVLGRNPLDDIAATQSVAAVVLAGELLVRKAALRAPPLSAVFAPGWGR